MLRSLTTESESTAREGEPHAGLAKHPEREKE